MIDHVKEVQLVGAADRRFWTRRLRVENLFAFDDDGAAQVSITGTQLRWKGIRFRELTISVAVSQRQDGQSHDGYYLLHAYNSVTALAWMERRIFHTPYHPASILLEYRVPAGIQLREEQGRIFEARMGVRRTYGLREDTDWSGPIFLPRRKDDSASVGELFSARLAGLAEVYGFDPGFDTLQIPVRQEPVWDALIASGFIGREWRIRDDAHHAKSKTYPRPPT